MQRGSRAAEPTYGWQTLLFAGVNSAEFIGRRGLHPDDRVIGEESQHALYVMSIPSRVEVFHHSNGVCHECFLLTPTSLKWRIALTRTHDDIVVWAGATSENVPYSKPTFP
jgi:hypothetical protein